MYHEERTLLPGAAMSGLTCPATAGPRLEKEETVSEESVEPTPMTLVRSPGELAVPQDGPELPMAKIGMTPAACQALTTAR